MTLQQQCALFGIYNAHNAFFMSHTVTRGLVHCTAQLVGYINPGPELQLQVQAMAPGRGRGCGRGSGCGRGWEGGGGRAAGVTLSEMLRTGFHYDASVYDSGGPGAASFPSRDPHDADACARRESWFTTRAATGKR